MKFMAARSRLKEGGDAAEEILYSLRSAGCVSPDLISLFVTSHHREAAAQMADRLRMELSPGVLIGCTCEGVIGVDEEIERNGHRLTAPHSGDAQPHRWRDPTARGHRPHAHAELSPLNVSRAAAPIE